MVPSGGKELVGGFRFCFQGNSFEKNFEMMENIWGVWREGRRAGLRRLLRYGEVEAAVIPFHVRS
jgi:hypothetical protein